MEETITNTNVENTSVTPSSDDSMMAMLIKTVVVVLLGGLIAKLFRKAVNWFKEGQRLRREEKDRKEAEESEKIVEARVKARLDSILADQVKSKEEESNKD